MSQNDFRHIFQVKRLATHVSYSKTVCDSVKIAGEEDTQILMNDLARPVLCMISITAKMLCRLFIFIHISRSINGVF
jgi:hypothetical protein